MRQRLHAMVPSEAAEFADEIRQIFLELGRTFASDVPVGQCSPSVDVYEREDAIEVVMDLPGVDASAVRVIAKGDTVLIVGEKTARRARPESSFHLVERDFGRFARAVRLGPACDTSRAQARLTNGELQVSLPKVNERRGRTISIQVVASDRQ